MNTEHLQAQMCKCKRQPDNDGIMQGIQATGGREQNVIHEKKSDLDSIVVDISAQVYLPTQGFIIRTHKYSNFSNVHGGHLHIHTAVYIVFTVHTVVCVYNWYVYSKSRNVRIKKPQLLSQSKVMV